MGIHWLQQNFELEKDGKTSLTLIGIRYTGNRATKSVDVYRREAAWPGVAPLQGGAVQEDGSREPGPMQFGLVPDWTDEDVEDRTVIKLERDPDIEVVYDPASIAHALLQKNYLPPEVFDRGYEVDLREKVFDALGLKDVGARNVPGYREQLREIAGLEDDLKDDAARDNSRVTELVKGYPRRDLLEAAEAFGFSESNAGLTDVAEFLADQDNALVEQAIDDPDSVDIDVDSWHNWNEEDWLSLDYPDRAADVEDGLVDEHLDEIEEVETSSTVEDAVDARREELEDE